MQEGIKVRGTDLLQALSLHRLDVACITPVDPATEAFASRPRRTANNEARDAAATTALAAFIDGLDDGACHRGLSMQ